MEISAAGNRRFRNGMNQHQFLKRIASPILIPLTRWYLRKERLYSYKNIGIKVLPSVFHPGLFPSTSFLLSYLETQNLENSTLLELGCGTGLISILAACKGARVTAIDLNRRAVENCQLNASSNGVNITTLHSDLFTAISFARFDWIVINPPYYKMPVHNDVELAWNCGENFEYFKKLFATLKDHILPQSTVIMVLTLGCDISSIQAIARENHFDFDLIAEKKVLFDEKDFLFRITQIL
jgi:release factor glutamine methyltransferase